MSLHTKKLFNSHIFSQKKVKEKKVGKERKVGNIGQIIPIRNAGKSGIVIKVPNSFK